MVASCYGCLNFMPDLHFLLGEKQHREVLHSYEYNNSYLQIIQCKESTRFSNNKIM